MNVINVRIPTDPVSQNFSKGTGSLDRFIWKLDKMDSAGPKSETWQVF
jgi:hypothetical protein